MLPLQVDLWPFDLEIGVRVTRDMSYLCTKCNLPMPLCFRLRPDEPCQAAPSSTNVTSFRSPLPRHYSYENRSGSRALSDKIRPRVYSQGFFEKISKQASIFICHSVLTHNNAKNVHKASGQATRKAKGHQCWLP